jgi:16S rRNA (cytidine1402-2'-O)-methyltransferase
VVARELTKVHEEVARGPLSELAERFAAGARGEVTIVIAAAAEGTRVLPEQEPLEAELARRVAAGDAPSAIAREVARGRRLKRADVYAALQRLKQGS